jgi:hypothetical protein
MTSLAISHRQPFETALICLPVVSYLSVAHHLRRRYPPFLEPEVTWTWSLGGRAEGV